MNFGPNELPLLSAGIAIAFAECLSTDELNFFGNLIATIGAEMMTIAAAQELQKTNNNG